jgi:hypothetical protein
MNIVHENLFDIEKVTAHYTEKDGEPVHYVCTTDLNASDVPVDVYYRATPHPQFGNRYFGLYHDHVRGHMMITNADIVESLEFGMIQHDGKYYYSQSHHDYKVIGDKMIDGGRAYVRSSHGAISMRIKDGRFYANDIQDLVALGDTKEYVYPGKDCQI